MLKRIRSRLERSDQATLGPEGAARWSSEKREPSATLRFFARGAGPALLAQIVWFNRLRFAAGLSVWFGTGFAAAFGVLDEAMPLYVLGAVVLLVDLAYTWSVRHLDVRKVETLRHHVMLQIGVDLVVLTGILHYSGGVTNPLVLAFLFHTLIAAFVLDLWTALVVLLASIGLVGGLAITERQGLVDHHPLLEPLIRLDDLTDTALGLWLTALAVTFGSAVYLVSTVVRRLDQRDEELLSVSRQLAVSEKLASVGTLAAGVSHEINNPVSVIRSKATILRYRISDGDPPAELLQELDTIEKHTKRIGSITAGLLAFSRETPFEIRPLRANALVEEAAELVRVPYKSASLGLDLGADPDDAQIAGSANHLLQVLVNVLLNAKDASDKGLRVSMSIESMPHEVALRIRDQGEGIPADRLDQIFDPFFTTKDVDSGTGLGLALSYGIVERHGGRMEVESEVGVGTCFTVWLPRAG